MLSAATTIPQRTCVLVIGGGPGGSYASTVLKHEGLDVVLLEASKHPRYHVGEGMLPSMRHYLRFINAEEQFHNHGFMHKPGACFKLNQDKQETCKATVAGVDLKLNYLADTDFSALGPSRTTWNVIRSEADEMLFRHATREGVLAFEETRVQSIEFEGDPASSRPVKAVWKNNAGETGEIEFDWLIDASGKTSIMANKYLKNRIFREGLRNIAVWGYWRDVKVYAEGTKRSNSPWFEAMIDELGWAWLIPLHDGTTSIGIVMHADTSKRKKSEYPGGLPSLTDHYLEQMKLLPGVIDLIGDNGRLVTGSVKSSSDYSYFAPSYSGDHFRLVGDAACFIDPFFSSGVHLAMTGALAAASTICASIKGQINEKEAQQWHDAKVGIAHTRFLLVVLSAYKQMHNQSKPILSDVQEDNYEKAFKMFRPVIMGAEDTESKHLSNKELDGMVDFCIHLFEPTVEEQHKAVAEKYRPDLLKLSGPVMGPKEVGEAVEPDDEDAKAVLSRMNALKILRNDTSCESFGTEELNGYVVQLERGNLGLVKA